jgi:chemotaxis protein MotB
LAKDNDERQPIIIIKKVKKMDGGHHGGAWKVAYADFVTAMMAFFLLLWLLNVTTDEQKELISSYFAPADPRIAESMSGAGGVLGGTTLSSQGAMSQQQAPVSATAHELSEDGLTKGDSEEQKAAEEQDRQDKKAFDQTEESLRQAIDDVPELKEFKQNLLIDMTPEGLRIQIVDQEGKPMFEVGSAKPLPQTERLLGLIAQVIKDLPNRLSIRGHTDSRAYGKDAAYTNWELSADRANASRRVLLAAKLDPGRTESVQGKADREPLVPSDLDSARNRRVSLILLRQALVAGLHKTVNKKSKGPELPQPKKKEEGVIYFP